MTIPRDIQQFTTILRALGAPVALAYLNAGVPHRYTAIYRLDNGEFENVFLHDKQGEVIPAFLEVVPFEMSFCQFVLKDTAFSTDDSSIDTRLDGHRYQGVVFAYHGVPICDAKGDLIGTMCHFDVARHSLPDGEFELLQAAARSIPAELVLRPPARMRRTG